MARTALLLGDFPGVKVKADNFFFLISRISKSYI